MDFVEESVIGPGLAENVARGVTAVGYAFLFTLIFFALYYRMFGLITRTALLLNPGDGGRDHVDSDDDVAGRRSGASSACRSTPTC